MFGVGGMVVQMLDTSFVEMANERRGIPQTVTSRAWAGA